MDPVAFVMDPKKWPLPVLPMFKRGSTIADDDGCGVIYPDNLRKVYHANIMEPLTRETKFDEYGSVEEMLAVWRID